MTTAHPSTSQRVPPTISAQSGRGVLAGLRRDPLLVYQMAQREHGDVVRLRVFGPVYIYLVSHPDDIAYVLRANWKNYPKGFISDVLRPSLGQGLLTSEGEVWKQQRRLMQPSFHRRPIADLTPIMADAAAKLVTRWQALARSGQPVDVAAEMSPLTLEIVSRALFGQDVSGAANSVRDALAILNAQATYRYLHPFGLPPWVPTPRNRQAARAVRSLDLLVQQIIRERRQRSGEHNDLLAMLLSARDNETGLGMSDQQLRDEVLTILLAGHETTANALAWTWYLLATHPAVERQLHAEVAAVLQGRTPTLDDLPRLRYTRMVLDESLRLYPPAWGTARQARAADQIRGYHIPAKAPVVISQYVTHRHPDFWTNPDMFEPLRFAPNQSGAGAQHPFVYFPFSAGPRQCIGKHFALLEAQIILATVVQHFRMALVPGQAVQPVAELNLRPRHGVNVTLHAQGAVQHE